MISDCAFLSRTATVPTARLFPSWRLAVSLMCSMILCLIYVLRVNISISLVCMVKPSAKAHVNTSFIEFVANVSAGTDAVPDGTIRPENCTEPVEDQKWTSEYNLTECSSPMTHHKSLNVYEGEFDWDKQLQGFILSSYFLGYLTTQALGGWLGGRYGGKHVAGTGLLISVVTTVVLPSAARLSPYFVIALRILLGAASGVVLSCVQSLLGRWAPPLERTLLSALALLGMTLGTIMAFLVSAHFCELRLDNGWPFAFYSTGAAGFVLWIVWNLTVFNTPDDHPQISKRELIYISHYTGLASDSGKTHRRPFPWLKALSSKAVLAIVCAQTSSTWLLYTNITTFPMYMKDVLKFDIKQNGLYLMLPHIIIIIFSPVVAQLADTMRRKHILSTVAVRKISQSISNFVSAALVVSLSFVDHDSRFIAVGIFVVMTTTQGVFDRVGIFVNPQDIAPRYSGEVFGITNTAATLSGIIAPTVCGILTPNGTADEWKIVFYIAAAILAVGGIVFCVFAEGEILPWARDEGYTVAKCTTVDVADAQPAPAAAEHKDFDEFTDNVHKDEAINATNADRLAYEAKPNL